MKIWNIAHQSFIYNIGLKNLKNRLKIVQKNSFKLLIRVYYITYNISYIYSSYSLFSKKCHSPFELFLFFSIFFISKSSYTLTFFSTRLNDFIFLEIASEVVIIFSFSRLIFLRYSNFFPSRYKQKILYKN